MPDFVNATITILQLLISFGTVCTLLYTFVRFSQKPSRTQDERIASLETRVEHLEECGLSSASHIAAIDEGNKVMQQAMLAMLDHAIGNEDVDSIKKARSNLFNYLTNRGVDYD